MDRKIKRRGTVSEGLRDPVMQFQLFPIIDIAKTKCYYKVVYISPARIRQGENLMRGERE